LFAAIAKQTATDADVHAERCDWSVLQPVMSAEALAAAIHLQWKTRTLI